MSDVAIHEYLVRLGRLLQAEDRSAGSGLQPVQLEALRYLARCNRYSDRPAAVAEYLGITKGTASQTLRVLEANGWIEKRTDPVDRRVVRLRLTRVGQELLERVGPSALLHEALAESSAAEREALEQGLAELLRGLQRANHGRTFGICRTCRHFQRGEAGSRCGLTGEALSVEDGALLCREHEEAS